MNLDFNSALHINIKRFAQCEYTTDFSTDQLTKGNNKRSLYFVLFRTGQELLAILDGDPFGVLGSPL